MRTPTFLFFLFCVALHAEDIKTTDGQILKDATITGRDALGVIISHSDGIARVAYDKLPEELRKQYNIDPKQAQAQAAVERAAAKQRAQAAQALEQQKAAAAKATAAEATQNSAIVFEKPRRGTIGKPGIHILRVSGQVLQIMPDGVLLGEWQSHTLERDGNRYGSNVMSEPLFVAGAPANLVDGEKFSGVVYPAGRYTYTSVIGAGKTIHRYATSPQLATKLQKSK